MSNEKNIVNKQAGNILKEAIRKHPKTQIDLAEMLDISTKQLQNYSRGVFPKYKGDNIKALDSILGTKVYPLIYNSEIKSEENIPQVPQEMADTPESPETIAVKKESLETAIIHLTATADRRSVIDEINARNLERLITLIEKKFERETEYNFPEVTSENLDNKKTGSKAS